MFLKHSLKHSDQPHWLNQWCEFEGGAICLSDWPQKGSVWGTWLKTIIISDSSGAEITHLAFKPAE